MAQIVLPLVVLGTAYLVSNTNDNDITENMSTITQTTDDLAEIKNQKLENFKKNNPSYNIPGHPHHTEYNKLLLAYENIHRKNLNPSSLGVPKYINVNDNNVEYADSNIENVYQDKYFNHDKTPPNAPVGEFVSLTGNTVKSNTMSHNNMTPYFSSKLSGPNVDNHSVNESVLDNYLGSGTYQTEKTERGPLFSPENNIQNVYGVQNTNDFYQSRIVPSQRVANVKPWQEERVAPGLNQGYTTNGEGGYNSGLSAREQWVPKGVDELRTANNRKESFTLNNHQGPALNPVKELGIMGKMDKHSPDTYYINNPNRWFTTTGAHKGKTMRSVDVIPEGNRNNTSVEYYGARGRDDGHGGGTGYVEQKYEESNKITLPANPFINLTAEGTSDPSKRDYGNNSYKLLKNNRSENNNGIFGNAYGSSGVLKSILNPIMNTLRHTKKENVVGNVRETGNFGSSVRAPTVYNIQNLPRTNREMIEHKLDCTHLNYQGQIESGPAPEGEFSVNNQRSSLNYESMGNVGGVTNVGLKTYDAAYKQRNNNNKTHENHPNMGGMSLFNPYENVNCTAKEVPNNRANTMDHAINVSPDAQFIGQTSKMPQQYENRSDQMTDADLLSAFKNNPYTQPLNSVA